MRNINKYYNIIKCNNKKKIEYIMEGLYKKRN